MKTHHEIELMLQVGIKMLKEINIPISNSICPTIAFPKAHSFYGMCHSCRPSTNLPLGYDFYIRISEFTLNNTDSSLMNTILHELLHTCPNCQNHQKLWQSYAQKVHDIYGYDIKRCGGDEQDKQNLRDSSKPKIYIQCPKCKHAWVRFRNSRLTLHPELYKCTCCGHVGLVRI